MKGRRQEASENVKGFDVPRLLVIVIVVAASVGRSASFIPVSYSLNRRTSPSTSCSPMSAVSIAIPSIHMTRRCAIRSPFFFRRETCSAARRHPSLFFSEKAESPLSGATLNYSSDTFSDNNCCDGNSSTKAYSSTGSYEQEVEIDSSSSSSEEQQQGTPQQEDTLWESNGWGEWREGGPDIDEEDSYQEEGGASSSGFPGGVGLGSEEFVSLVKSQFEVIATAIGASQIVLFVRVENAKTGGAGFDAILVELSLIISMMVFMCNSRLWLCI